MTLLGSVNKRLRLVGSPLFFDAEAQKNGGRKNPVVPISVLVLLYCRLDERCWRLAAAEVARPHFPAQIALECLAPSMSCSVHVRRCDAVSAMMTVACVVFLHHCLCRGHLGVDYWFMYNELHFPATVCRPRCGSGVVLFYVVRWDPLIHWYVWCAVHNCTWLFLMRS